MSVQRIVPEPEGEDRERAVTAILRRLDTLDAGYIRFREQEVGVPGADDDGVPLRAHVAAVEDHSKAQTEWINEKLLPRIEALEEHHRNPQRDWFLVNDPAVAMRWLRDLEAWYVRVYQRRTGVDLPACWVWHPGVVDDLLAMQAHHMWASKQSQPTYRTQYRQVWLSTNGGIKAVDALRDCRDGGHYDPDVVGGVHADWGQLRGEYVEWWVNGGEGTPPGLPE